ncbi:hypothetical protein KC221_30765, partial [Mycobacterium tuberculosis]|nr:hypothetical protein [Mycobacterium tuberculosis]
EIPADLRARLTELEAQAGVTTFMLLHAALAILVASSSAPEDAGRHDVVIGAPIAGRGVAVLDDMVGMFVNSVVLRT